MRGYRLLSGTTNIYLKGLFATGTNIMCDVPAIADGTVLANRPDTVLHGKKKKTCTLIDTAIADDPNADTKETEKLSTKSWTSQAAGCGE